jgi:putative lipoprotein
MLAAVALAACGDPGNGTGTPAGREDAMAVVEGEVFYRERMMLPPGFEVEVQLQDISRADAMASVLATVTLQPGGAPPYPFSIQYDPATIDPRLRYALRATISRGGELLFSSDEYIDPFAGNPVQVLVRRVAEPVQHAAAALDEGVWVLATLAGEPAPTGAGGRSVTLQFDAAEMRAAGFSGCNRYTGGYSREGASEHGSPLAFKAMAGTLMACQDGGDLERRYLQMLGGVTAFRLQAGTLSLMAGPEVVATFTLN